jgi:Galactose oxidase-like, Early set domain/IPT/TIG domain
MATRVSSSLYFLLVCSLVIPAFAIAGIAQANVQGQWSTISTTMPINPIHVALLSTGNILVVAGSGNCPPSQSGCPSGPPYGTANGSGALLFNPVSEEVVNQFSQSWDTFCNGMVLLDNGRALIDGGTIQYDPFYGQPQVLVFNPVTNTFSNAKSMAHGRWYPTVLTLGDGRVMAFSGLNESGSTNTAMEFYTVGSGWSEQYFASWTPDLYPRLHLLPDGNVFYSGAQTVSKLLNLSNLTWNTDIATTNYSGTRTYGTSVLLPLTPANNYDPKIMIFGGGSPATNTTEIIDMGAASPKWVYGPNMSEARIEMNAVILPNGNVLALGGSVNDEDTGSLSLNADLFNVSNVNLTTQPPNVGTMSSAGANATERLYHSVALLLPDATVWLAGGNPERGTYNNTVEIYQPAYLFNSNGSLATRPTITSAPSNLTYGGTFRVKTPSASSISSVVLVRNGTVTHAFGMDQRMVEMSFTVGSGEVTATAPPNGNIAPPGYYMMFILNSSGVPSLAKIVHIGAAVPTITKVSPNTGATAGGTAVTITGTNFTSGAAVTFGGAAATNIDVVNSTTITAKTPSHAAGAVAVAVTIDGQTATLANGYTYSGPAPISFAQVAAATPQSATSSVTVTFPQNQTAGDLNVVVVGWNDSTSTVKSVTDSAKNTYSPAIGVTSGTNLRQSIYYASNIAGGTNTVTVTFNQSASDPDIRILEYQGVKQVDVTAGASGNSSTANSGSATTTSSNELIFGADIVRTGNASPGSGFTARIITTPDSDLAEDKVVTATGSNSATATLTSSGAWVMQMVTFK